jgi:hypothetical protein
MSAILDTARAAYAAGLTPLPASGDGSKKPDVRQWKTYQTTRPSVDDMRTFNFAAHDGLGIIAGAGGGFHESWDFDDGDVFDQFVARAHASGLGELVDRLCRGYLDVTPAGGRRVLVAYPPDVVFKDCTLARRPGRSGEPAVKVLIELPTFAIIAPSNGGTHPTGKPYVRLSGDFPTIARYTADERQALITLARTFDQMPRPEARATVPSDRLGTRPGDDFGRRTTWPALLEPAGWTSVFERESVTFWRRPGKDRGISATTNYAGSDLLFVFTSSTMFDPDKSYTKFGALTVLQYNGDYGRAALALFKDGFGADVEDDAETETTRATTESSTTTTPTSRSLRLTAANTIELRPVHWLWDKRLALGTFVLLGGREGIGKSILTYTLTADITKGTLPGIYCGTPKSVVVAATEDSWQHTICPRLLAAGADLSRVYRADIVDADGFEWPLSLPKDTAALCQALKDNDAAVLVFDPLLSRLDGRLDSHKDADVRRALEPLAAMAETANVVVLGLIHVSKATSSDALTLLMASRAFAAVARAVLFVAVNPDNESQRLLGQPKNNNGSTELPTLMFQINGVLVETTASGEEIWTGQLQWQGESDQTIREVLERVGEHADVAQARREAEAWLIDMLERQGGTAAKKVIVAAAQQAGHSRATLYRARQHAGILIEPRGHPPASYWILPVIYPSTSPDEAPSSQSSQLSHVSGPQQAETSTKTNANARLTGRETGETGETTEIGETAETAETGRSHPPSQGPGPVRRETTETGETTEPEPENESERRWRETSAAFKKGWK